MKFWNTGKDPKATRYTRKEQYFFLFKKKSVETWKRKTSTIKISGKLLHFRFGKQKQLFSVSCLKLLDWTWTRTDRTELYCIRLWTTVCNEREQKWFFSCRFLFIFSFVRAIVQRQWFFSFKPLIRRHISYLSLRFDYGVLLLFDGLLWDFGRVF